MIDKAIDTSTVIINDRSSAEIGGVKSVVSFDDETILLDSILGKITIKGEELTISSFNEEIGDFKATGKIHGVIYLSDNKNGGFFSRLIK